MHGRELNPPSLPPPLLLFFLSRKNKLLLAGCDAWVTLYALSSPFAGLFFFLFGRRCVPSLEFSDGVLHHNGSYARNKTKAFTKNGLIDATFARSYTHSICA